MGRRQGQKLRHVCGQDEALREAYQQEPQFPESFHGVSQAREEAGEGEGPHGKVLILVRDSCRCGAVVSEPLCWCSRENPKAPHEKLI